MTVSLCLFVFVMKKRLFAASLSFAAFSRRLFFSGIGQDNRSVAHMVGEMIYHKSNTPAKRIRADDDVLLEVMDHLDSKMVNATFGESSKRNIREMTRHIYKLLLAIRNIEDYESYDKLSISLIQRARAQMIFYPEKVTTETLLNKWCTHRVMEANGRKTNSILCSKILLRYIEYNFAYERLSSKWIGILNKNEKQRENLNLQFKQRARDIEATRSFLNEFLQIGKGSAAIVYNCQIYCQQHFRARHLTDDQVKFANAFLDMIRVDDFTGCDQCDPCQNEAHQCFFDSHCKREGPREYSCECPPDMSGDGTKCSRTCQNCHPNSHCGDFIIDDNGTLYARGTNLKWYKVEDGAVLPVRGSGSFFTAEKEASYLIESTRFEYPYGKIKRTMQIRQCICDRGFYEQSPYTCSKAEENGVEFSQSEDTYSSAGEMIIVRPKLVCNKGYRLNKYTCKKIRPSKGTTIPTTKPTTKSTTKPTTIPTTKPTTIPTTEPTTKPTTYLTTKQKKRTTKYPYRNCFLCP